jgi:hypothetical protein
MVAQFSFQQSLVTMQLMALCAYSSPWPKKPFESGSTRRNKESWGKGKTNKPDISFAIPQSFVSYFHFLFYLILVFHLSYLIYFLTFALPFMFHLAFINFQTTLGDTESYNHSLVWRNKFGRSKFINFVIEKRLRMNTISL